MSLLLQSINRNSKIFPRFVDVVFCRRWASRCNPYRSYTKLDELRDKKWQERTAALVAGTAKKKKGSSANTVEGILKSLNHDPSEIPKNFVIKKLPKTTSPRLRQLSNIFFEHIANLVQTKEVCSNLADLGFEVTNVTVAPHLASVIVSWQLANPEAEPEIVSHFQKSSSEIREALTNMRVIGQVPPILFHRDMSQNHIDEIDHLLSIADMGPEEDRAIEGHDSGAVPTDIKRIKKLGRLQRHTLHNDDDDDNKRRSETKEYACGVNYDQLKEELLNVKNKVPGKLTVESALDKKLVTIDVNTV